MDRTMMKQGILHGPVHNGPVKKCACLSEGYGRAEYLSEDDAFANVLEPCEKHGGRDGPWFTASRDGGLRFLRDPLAPGLGRGASRPLLRYLHRTLRRLDRSPDNGFTRLWTLLNPLERRRHRSTGLLPYLAHRRGGRRRAQWSQHERPGLAGLSGWLWAWGRNGLRRHGPALFLRGLRAPDARPARGTRFRRTVKHTAGLLGQVLRLGTVGLRAPALLEFLLLLDFSDEPDYDDHDEYQNRN